MGGGGATQKTEKKVQNFKFAVSFGVFRFFSVFSGIFRFSVRVVLIRFFRSEV